MRIRVKISEVTATIQEYTIVMTALSQVFVQALSFTGAALIIQGEKL